MRRRFELTEGSSSKFWEIEFDEETLTVRFGRLGTEGQTQTKTLGASAKAASDKLVAEKQRKGYREVTTNDALAETSFVHQVLTVEGKPAERLKKLVAASAPREAVVDAAAGLVDPARPPEWIKLVGKDVEDLIHLAPPMFTAAASDGDAFYDDACAGQVVYQGKGRAERFDRNRKATKETIADKDIGRITAYATGSEVVLYGLTWIEAKPSTLKELDTLLGAADGAFHDEIDGYELRASASPIEKKPSSPVPIIGASAASGGSFLGGAARTSCFASLGPLKAPKLKWVANLASMRGDEWGGSVVFAEGLFFAGSGWAQKSASFGAVDANGKKVWEQTMSTAKTWCASDPCVADGVLYLGTNQGLYALDAKTGKVRWQAKLANLHASAPAIQGGLVIVATKQSVVGLDAADGRKKWELPLAFETPRPIALGGHLGFALGEEKLVAFDAASGKAVWSTERGYAAVGPVFVDGVVLFGGPPRAIEAVDAAKGKRKWTTKAGFEVSGDHPLAVSVEAAIVVAHEGERGRLAALRLDDGKPLWTTQTEGQEFAIGTGRCAPAIAGRVVYSGLSDESADAPALGAFDLKTGKELWRKETLGRDDCELRLDTSPIVHDGKLYVQTTQGLACLL